MFRIRLTSSAKHRVLPFQEVRLPPYSYVAIQGSSPGRVKNFLHVVQTGSGVHPTSYPMAIAVLSLGVKRPGHEADHSPPASTEVKKIWICISTPVRLYGVVLN
jgi:hypothetical protein